ncbi:MAG: phenylacetate-CoA oxygenase subunit PaaJ [Saprospiraceae bacterium]|nr:phenylacetate-CoA oxygenase subunit PaaJ [Saprospiraceae bacterium]
MHLTQIDPFLASILETVADPEIPVLSIMDLGIVRKATLAPDGTAQIEITPTYSGCPATDMIKAYIGEALKSAGFTKIDITYVLSPPWTTDWLTEEGKRKLKAYGIAPPVEKTSDISFLRGGAKVIHCPLCDSANTEMVSLFGSTACKSLYRCLACLEPFDYFKCH